MPDLENARYDHAKTEKEIYELWERSGYFNPDNLPTRQSLDGSRCLAGEPTKKSSKGHASGSPIPYTLAADIAASAQEAIVETLVKKTIRATKEFRAKSIILCGGVAANSYLKSIMGKATSDMGISFFVPDFAYNTDNAVMIAAAGYLAHLRKKRFPLVANGNLGI